MRITINIGRSAGLERRLNQMAATLNEILDRQVETLDVVTEDNDLDNSIATILDDDRQTIADLRDQLAEAGGDPAKVQTVLDNMDKILTAMKDQRDRAKAAIVANTPAADVTDPA